MRWEVFETPEDLALEAVRFFTRQAVRAVAERGRFFAALSGGTTPLATYRLLGQPPLVHEMPWPNIHLFWGDERCVPSDHELSNYRSAIAALKPPANLSGENIHRIPAEQGPVKGAAQYEKELRVWFGKDRLPVFDLLLLGLGTDGHTASLFPNSPALTIMDRLAIGVEVSSEIEPRLARVTLSLPVINASRQVLFLVSGADKAAVVKRIRENASGNALQYPAVRVRPAGDLIWFLDREAWPDRV